MSKWHPQCDFCRFRYTGGEAVLREALSLGLTHGCECLDLAKRDFERELKHDLKTKWNAIKEFFKKVFKHD